MFHFRPSSYLSTALVVLPFLALGVPGFLLAGCLGKEEAKAPPPEIVRPARVAEIVYRTDTQRLTLAATVAPRYEVNLGFRVAGKIISREVEVGDIVQPGQVLARLDHADFRHALDTASAALAAADADYVRARADLDRYAALRATTAFVPQMYDQRIATAQSAQARLEQAKSQVAIAENNLAYTTLHADSAGVITAIQAEVGQVVAQGQGMLRLARTEELEVLVSVPEQRLASLRNAPEGRFDLWSEPGRQYRARLRELSPSADPTTRTYAARFTMLERPEFIGMGMTANLQLEQPGGERAAELPLSALYQQGKQPAVWVLDKATSKVALRPVILGRLREDSVLIASGLEQGELVVTAGVHKLEAGQKIRPVLQPAPPQQAMR